MSERNHNELSCYEKFCLISRRLFFPFVDEVSLIPSMIAYFGGIGIGITCFGLFVWYCPAATSFSPSTAVCICIDIPIMLAMVFAGLLITNLIRCAYQNCVSYLEEVQGTNYYFEARLWLYRRRRNNNQTTIAEESQDRANRAIGDPNFE